MYLKYRLTTIIVWLFVACNVAAQSITSVAFYNMENLFDPSDDPANPWDNDFTPGGSYHYTADIYHSKLHNIATVIQQMDVSGPALLGCAEVENAQVLTDLLVQPELVRKDYKFIHYDSPDARGIDVALIYNPAYFTVLSSKPISVNIEGTGGKETTRDILYVCGILSGDTIHVLVNHWPSRRGGEAATDGKRLIAAQVNKHIVDSLLTVKPSAKIILMGDLNDDPTSPGVKDGLMTKGDTTGIKPQDLYNPWEKLKQGGIGTTTFNDEWNLFDQVILSGQWLKHNGGWSFAKAEIFNNPFLLKDDGRHKGFPKRSFENNTWVNGYSDHLPVIVYLVK